MLSSHSTMNSTELYSDRPTQASPSTQAFQAKGSVVHVTFLVLGGILSLCVNSIALHKIYCVKRFWRPENYMLANLCVSSSIIVLTTAVGFSIQSRCPIAEAIPGICYVLGLLHYTPVMAETLSIMFVSLDRLRTVRRPMDRETVQSARNKIIFIWTFSFLMNIPGGMLVFVRNEGTSGKLCRMEKRLFGSATAHIVFQAIFIMTGYIIPCILLLFESWRTITKFKSIVIPSRQNLPGNGNILEETRKRLLRHALIFTVAFVVFKLPSGLFEYVYRFPPEFLRGSPLREIRSWREVHVSVGLTTTILSPLLVLIVSTDLQQHTLRRPRADVNLVSIYA